MGFANWWDETVVPRVIKYGCGTERMMKMRRDIIPSAQGRVFELGCGAGANQVLLAPGKVSSFTAIEPSPKLRDYARAAAAKLGLDADIGHGHGEAIPYADESFDTVICTFTLCSVCDQGRSLSELRRILKPGGLFLFAEHGRAPDARIFRRQQRIEPVWKKLFGNCHLTRPVSEAIEQAGFAVEPVGRGYRDDKPGIIGWMEWGSAVKLG